MTEPTKKKKKKPKGFSTKRVHPYIIFKRSTIKKKSGFEIEPTVKGGIYNSYRISKGYASISFTVSEMDGCCGGIYVWNWTVSPTTGVTDYELVVIATEFLHNLMKQSDRPVAQAALTNASYQRAWAFEAAGWDIGWGSRSMKHPDTNSGIDAVANVIFPASLLLKSNDKGHVSDSQYGEWGLDLLEYHEDYDDLDEDEW